MNVCLLSSRSAIPAPEEACTAFIAAAQLMLDPATPESRRMQVEPQLVAQLPVLRALGVFDLFVLRDPALRTLVDDELAALPGDRRSAA